MSQPQKQDNSLEEAAPYIVGAAAVFALAMWVLARLPIIILGALTARAAVANAKRQDSKIDSAWAFIGTLSVVFILFYALFGISGVSSVAKFEGILWNFNWYYNLIIDLADTWNRIIPDFTKGLKIHQDQIKPLEISKFVWSSLFIGTIIGLSAPTLIRLIWRKKENYTYDFAPESDLVIAMTEIPLRIFELCIFNPIKFFIEIGHRLAIRLLRFDLMGVIHSGMQFLFIVAGVLIVGNLYKLLNIQSTELNFVVFNILAAFPFFAFLAGAVLGIIPFYGDQILYELFKSSPEGNIPEAKQKKRQGFILGETANRRPFYLTESNLSYHVEIVAPTGSGKTNILKNLIANRIQEGHGVIFLDYKADFDVLSWMYRVCLNSERQEDLRLISLADPELSVPYNPISEGSAPELTSRLMNSFEWSKEQFYLNAAKSALSKIMRGLCDYRDLTGNTLHIGHIYKGLNEPSYLREIAEFLQKQKKQSANDLIDLAEKLERPGDAKELRGLVTNFEGLIYSSVGNLLTTDTEKSAYSLNEAIGKSRVTYCLMNSLLLKESSKTLGKLFLQDLMGFVGRRFAQIERSNQTVKPVTLIIDEFAAFAIPEFIDFLDRARSAGISCIIAHQDRADLKSISPVFQSRVEANTNTTIISGIKDPKDAEHFAGMIGTKTVVKETWQEEAGFFGSKNTGMKSLREVEEYVLHPNRIKSLQQGEVLAISRTIDPHFGVVGIPRAHEFLEVSATTDKMKSYFLEARSRYFPVLENIGNAAINVQPGLSQGQPEASLDKDLFA